ncbi:hypothetical protein FN846DRAFT_944186 [Sphaerosporella brunnea]|uniref:Uncharacterized protein n=1 Tax=Sphaerosporella brunnea TaxID=1250544 RepID=A0A5J5F0B9_9PEZI|nr:hypothetical protein FN846DRAFT_944186 [Sphaerosporella brunnea]
MSGFPTLKPWGTLLATISPPEHIGTLSSGGSQIIANITATSLKTEPDVTPALNATSVVFGGDWIHADPDGKHLRLDVRSVLRTDDGVPITFIYTGIISVSPATALALSGAPEAQTVPFGDIVSVPRFVTGHDKYQHLENMVFVGSGRFVITPGEPMKVEYKISEVLA